MNAQKFTRNLIVVLLLLVPAMIASAQDSTSANTLTLSEAHINAAIRAGMQNDANDLSVDLQPGQMILTLATTGQRGNTAEFTLTIVPSVTPGGDLTLDATRLTLNGNEINIGNNPAVNGTTNTVNRFLADQTGGGQVQSVTITDSELSIIWLNPNPNDPTITIHDNLLSVTFTESAINNMPWVTNPTGPNVSAIHVDLQPGQGIIQTTRTIEPTDVSYAVIPTVVNGRVAWQVNALADIETGPAATIITAWQAYWNSVSGKGSMVDAAITDDTITFTWDLGNMAEETNPVVTYTINEADVNVAFDAFETQELTDLSVDMQPGQIILNAAGVTPTGSAFNASATVRPELAGGKLTWTVDSVTINGFTIDPAEFQSGNQAAAALTQGLNGRREVESVTDVQITDDAVMVTVQYR